MRYLNLLFLLFIGNTIFALGIKPVSAFKNSAHMVLDTDTIIRKQSISVGVNYGSDAMFFGRTGPITYPFMSADVVYNSKIGFFVYGSVLRLIGYRTFVDEVDLGAGYLYRPTKKFSGSISYNRFIFNKEKRIIESATSNDINWKNSYDWKPFRSTVTLDYLFGQSSDFFMTISQSKYMETKGNIFTDEDYLSINPSISAIIGTQNFVQTYSLEHEDRLATLNIYKFGTGPYSVNNGRLNMLNYSFKLPVAYNTPHYTFEVAYKYSVPVNVEGSLQNKRESFLNLTFFYLFY